MGKCRNYLAAISQSYSSFGLLSVYEDSPCSCILGLTLTSHAVVSNSRGDPANIINSPVLLWLCSEILLCGGFTWLCCECLHYICREIDHLFIICWHRFNFISFVVLRPLFTFRFGSVLPKMFPVFEKILKC